MRRTDPRREQVPDRQQRRRRPLADDRSLLGQLAAHLLGSGPVTMDGPRTLHRPAAHDVGADGDTDLPATRTSLPNRSLPMGTHAATMRPRKGRVQG